MSNEETQPCSECGNAEKVTKFVHRDDPGKTCYLCSDCYECGLGLADKEGKQ